jgi:hypothetical protein
MSTRAVLEALAAGAGRQSAIGGLMFQDAQKREARDYEAALEKEKYRRSGEATALKNARGAWKFKAEKHYSQASKYYTSYVNAKRGVGVGGELDLFSGEGKYSEEDIAQFKLNYENAIREGNRAMKHFMRYSGIEEEYTPVPIEDLSKIAGGTGKAKSGAPTNVLERSADIVVGEYIKNSPRSYLTLGRQLSEGEDVDLNHFIETINSSLVDNYLAKREDSQLGYTGTLSDEDKKKIHMNSAQEKKVRARIRDRIKKEYSFEHEVRRADTGYPSRAMPEMFPTATAATVRDEVIAEGVGDELVDQDAYNQAISSEVLSRMEGTVTDPSVQAAEAVARDRAAEAAQAQDTPPRQGRGMISQGQYQKAYASAEQMLTQMFQQFGNVTLQQFQQIIAEQGLKGIELMAYRQAYKDLVGKKPTGLGFESGGLQERIDAGGSISSLSNVLFP